MSRWRCAHPQAGQQSGWTESTGLEGRTIHRLLEADPKTSGFKRSEEHPLGYDLLVVDKASMVDVPLMRTLLKALPRETALLLVGNVDQSPSVGLGQVLADIIGSDAVPVIRLAVRNGNARKRWSKLREWLQGTSRGSVLPSTIPQASLLPHGLNQPDQGCLQRIARIEKQARSALCLFMSKLLFSFPATASSTSDC